MTEIIIKPAALVLSRNSCLTVRLYAWIQRVCLCVSKYAFTSLSALGRRKAEILCANVDIAKL